MRNPRLVLNLDNSPDAHTIAMANLAMEASIAASKGIGGGTWLTVTKPDGTTKTVQPATTDDWATPKRLKQLSSTNSLRRGQEEATPTMISYGNTSSERQLPGPGAYSTWGDRPLSSEPDLPPLSDQELAVAWAMQEERELKRLREAESQSSLQGETGSNASASTWRTHSSGSSNIGSVPGNSEPVRADEYIEALASWRKQIGNPTAVGVITALGVMGPDSGALLEALKIAKVDLDDPERTANMAFMIMKSLDRGYPPRLASQAASRIWMDFHPPSPAVGIEVARRSAQGGSVVSSVVKSGYPPDLVQELSKATSMWSLRGLALDVTTHLSLAFTASWLADTHRKALRVNEVIMLGGNLRANLEGQPSKGALGSLYVIKGIMRYDDGLVYQPPHEVIPGKKRLRPRTALCFDPALLTLAEDQRQASSSVGWLLVPYGAAKRGVDF